MDWHDGIRAGAHHPCGDVAHTNGGDARNHGGQEVPSGTPSLNPPSPHERQLPRADPAAFCWYHPPPIQALEPLPTWDLELSPPPPMDSVMRESRGALPREEVMRSTSGISPGATAAAVAVAEAGENAEGVAGAAPADAVAAADRAAARTAEMVAAVLAIAFQGGPAAADAATIWTFWAPSPDTVAAADNTPRE